VYGLARHYRGDQRSGVAAAGNLPPWWSWVVVILAAAGITLAIVSTIGV
jgi:hypothetical protein